MAWTTNLEWYTRARYKPQTQPKERCPVSVSSSAVNSCMFVFVFVGAVHPGFQWLDLLCGKLYTIGSYGPTIFNCIILNANEFPANVFRTTIYWSQPYRFLITWVNDIWTWAARKEGTLSANIVRQVEWSSFMTRRRVRNTTQFVDRYLLYITVFWGDDFLFVYQIYNWITSLVLFYLNMFVHTQMSYPIIKRLIIQLHNNPFKQLQCYTFSALIRTPCVCITQLLCWRPILTVCGLWRNTLNHNKITWAN